jgi:hypothetical protein
MRDKAARQRLGRLLTQARVELDPRYRNRALFARERGINYRLAQDAENAATEVGGDYATRVAISLAYGWTPDSFDAVLAGGDPVRAERPQGQDDRPEIVRRLWDHEHVRTLWGIDRPEHERLALVRSYAATLAPSAPAEQRKRA